MERALTADWRRLQAHALIAGLHLEGDPGRRTGWPLGADLAITRPVLASAGTGPHAASDLMRLGRSPFNDGGLALELPHPVTIVVGSNAWRVWGARIEATVKRSGLTIIDGSSLRIAFGRGPDDVLTVATAAGTAAAQGGQVHLSFRLNHIILSLARATLSERIVEQARLELTLAGRPDRRSVMIDALDFDWNGLTVHLAGRLAADPSGTFSGRLALTLGRAWRDAIARAVAAGIITPAEARAAIGLIALIAHDGDTPDLPLSVQNGRISFAGLLLLTPQDLSPAASTRP